MFTWQYIKSTSFWKLLARNFYLSFTALWLFFGAIGTFWKDGLAYGVKAYFAFGFASLLIALYFSARPSSFTRRLGSTDTRITIQVSDLLDQTNNVVIGVADTFDTTVGEIISPKSVQGQFQNRYFPDSKSLDTALRRELDKVNVVERDITKRSGKQNRYPIGTVAVVEKEGNRYFLLAYTRMLSELRTDSDICMLATALEKGWESIRSRGQNQPVHMGIVGSRFARIGLSRSLLLHFIILSFIDAERRKHVTPHLTIHIHEADANEINFLDLSSWLKGVTSAA